MQKVRIKFHKTDSAKYTSHLDLNRIFIRSLCRAGLDVVYTKGFNPHPYIVFGPPLPLGFTSQTEILDFSLNSEMEFSEIEAKLQKALPMGFFIERAYTPKNKISDISSVGYRCNLEVNCEVNESLIRDIAELFDPELPLLIMKKSKRGLREIDINSMMQGVILTKKGEYDIELLTRVTCTPQDNLNPSYLVSAIEENIKRAVPIFAGYHRLSFFMQNGVQFDKNA